MDINLEGVTNYSVGKYFESEIDQLYCSHDGNVGVLSWAKINVYIIGGPLFLKRMKSLENKVSKLKELAFEIMKENMRISDYLEEIECAKEKGFKEGKEDVQDKMKDLLGIYHD